MSSKAAVDADLRLRQDRLIFMTLLVATLVCSFLPLPFALAGIVFGVWGVVQGLRVLGRLARARSAGRRVGGHLAVALGLGAMIVVVLELGGQAVYLRPSLDRQDCLDGATTLAAQQDCDRAFTRRVTGPP